MSAPSPVRIWRYNPTGTRSHRDICPPGSQSAVVAESGMSPPRLVGAVSSLNTLAHRTSSSSITLFSGVLSSGCMSNTLPGLEGKRSPPNKGCMCGGGNELNMSTPVVGNRTERLLKNGVR